MPEKNKVNILLIEDDEFLVRMYESKLSMEDFAVATALNGEQGLKLVQKQKPDVILLDIMMPTMDGWEVLKALNARKETKNIPVILLTNLGQKDEVEKGLALGAVDYLIKAHFTPAEVVEKIKKVIKK